MTFHIEHEAMKQLTEDIMGGKNEEKSDNVIKNGKM